MPEQYLGTVIHVGVRMDGPGGIAAVMRGLRDSALGERWRLVFVESITSSGPLLVRLWQSALFPPRVAIALIRHPGAMMHVHMSTGGSFWRKRMAIFLARCGRRPVLIHLHGGHFETWATENAARLRAASRILTSCSAVVALSDSWRERILALAPSANCVVIHNAVQLPDSPSLGSIPPRVVFLGKMKVEKGIEDVLVAARAIQERGIEASWVLAGEGDPAETRRKAGALQRPDLVEVPGLIGVSEKDRLLATSDVFLLPSFAEGLPLALLEAMSFGLACVVSPVGGIPDVVVDGENGLFVTPGDAKSILNGILSVLEDAALRRRLGENARRTVRECYSLSVVALQWARLYELTLRGG